MMIVDAKRNIDKRRLIICISRESNPGHVDGNDVFYH